MDMTTMTAANMIAQVESLPELIRTEFDRLDAAGTQAALAIAQRHEVPDIVARILAGRGVAPDDAAAFLEPSVKTLMPDPSSLTDMDGAADRIATAIIADEPIALFGDYDVDGASSCALFARFVQAQGRKATIYIPDRIFEGYGPNPDAIRKLAADGARLLVTLDCGSTSLEALAVAREKRDALPRDGADDRVARRMTIRRFDVMALDILEPRKAIKTRAADDGDFDAHASTA